MVLPPGGGRLGQTRIAEEVAAALRHRILTADLVNGSELPKQDELVAEFGVSYPSVREGLRILETEGLITIRRGNVGGAIVHAPDEGTAGYALGLTLQALRVNVTDLANALAELEPLAAKACAARPDRAEVVIPRLEELVAISEEHLTDDVEFTRIARAFHDEIVSFHENATLRLVIGSLTSLWSVQEEQWAQTAAPSGSYPAADERNDVIVTHRRIIELIAAGDGEAVARLAGSHLSATHQRVCLNLKDRVIDAASPQARARIRRPPHSRFITERRLPAE
ncbi:GntR family transcriptional regulator [Actinomadura sp. NBRC 104412]|uniref:FadR/GntR family transcriptional regulator n=1 Tax=Actinomadura sp. NBRC 104412 TaxID=3032203 RepID=UPI0024A23C67|nr:GntR family transcriptional regulator [Actinomadura sp. NBRC 104412]GLZ06174.1 GntR family transcriptional regulator [Actinomadura sp. NBRC 104412]